MVHPTRYCARFRLNRHLFRCCRGHHFSAGGGRLPPFPGALPPSSHALTPQFPNCFLPLPPLPLQYDRNNTGTVAVADLPSLLTELGVDDAAQQDVLGKVPADGAVTFGELQRLLSGEQQLPSEAPDPKVMEFLRILDEPVGRNE